MDQGIMTLITVAIVLAAAVFAFWVVYTVTWRAVRRGMLEFQRAKAATATQPAPPAGLSPFDILPPEITAADIVPDYPPREWV